MAATGPDPETPGTEGKVRQRQEAAAQLREFIRGLIRLRRDNDSADAAFDLIESLSALSEFQGSMLRERVWGIVNRVELTVAEPDLSAAPEPGLLTLRAPTTPDATFDDATVDAEGVRLSIGANLPAREESARIAVTTVLQALVAKAQERLSADLCQIFIEDKDALVLRAEAPAEWGTMPGPVTLSRATGLAKQFGGLARAVGFVDLSRLAGVETTWATRGVQRLAAVGVGSAGEGGSGILVAARKSTQSFTERDLDQMNHLASEVSSAMLSADLLSRAEELAVLQERMKLAREIHDGLASDLSAVVALFKYHDHRRKADPADADRLLEQIRDLADGALQSARDILATLRPRRQAPVNLVESVRRQVDDFGRSYGVAAIAHVDGDAEDLSGEERDAFNQILRESLTNVRKHSEATKVEVRLDLRRRPHTLAVDDDGIGLDLSAIDTKLGSFGLLGMRERADLVGGWIEVGSSPLGGARVLFRGPQVALASFSS